MGSLKSGLSAIAFASFLGTAAVVGCSASGGGADITSGADTTVPADDGTGATGKLPPSSGGNSGGGSTTDASTPKKDAGPKPDATVDAGPPPPVEGTACTTPNAFGNKTCGACGTAQAVCIAGDGGAATWGPYGACENEVVGGCVPGATQACGNCGTQTCTQYCGWGSCTGQAANSCAAGSIEYSTAGCPIKNTYQSRSCSASCQWGNFAGACESPSMTAPAIVGGLSTGKWNLAATRVGKKLTGSTCPGSVSSTATYPYFAVVVSNPTNKVATVQVYNSGVGTPLDTVLWVYNGATAPADDAAMQACAFGVADNCTALADACGNVAAGGSTYDWAGIDNVTIPANGSILVYTAGYGSSETGDFNLNIKTTKLQ
jgi:hypothetical protein